MVRASLPFASIFYMKMEKIYKNMTGLSILNTAFAVSDQKIIS